MALSSRGLLRLFLFLGGYISFLVLGATVFSAIESPEELQKVKDLRKLRADFLKKHPNVTATKIAAKSVSKSIAEEVQLSREAARIRYQQSSSSSSSESASTCTDISLAEAKQILDVRDLDPAQIHERYQFLFESNQKHHGGSFYLQSKIFRAKKRLDAETSGALSAAPPAAKM